MINRLMNSKDLEQVCRFYVTVTKIALPKCETVKELNAWWRQYKDFRLQLGIVEGNSYYDQIVNLFAERKAELLEQEKIAA